MMLCCMARLSPVNYPEVDIKTKSRMVTGKAAPDSHSPDYRSVIGVINNLKVKH